MMTVRQFQRLAALGAIGVGFGVVLLYALIAFGSMHTTTGITTTGIDRTNAALAMIGAAIPALAIIVVHLVYARMLMRESRASDA